MSWETIHTVDPPISGDHVRQAQRILAGANPFHEDFHPGPIDGVAGAAFSHALANRHDGAKWLLGYPKDQCTPVFGHRLYAFLREPNRPLPGTYRFRRHNRLRLLRSGLYVRRNVVQLAEWSYTHGPAIDYSTRRPGGPFTSSYRDRTQDVLAMKSPPVFLREVDCSMWCVSLAWIGGSRFDISGFNWSGYGNSQSVADTMKIIPQGSAQPADMACWPGHHVEFITAVGQHTDATMTVISQGGDPGPWKGSLAASKDWHRRHGDGEPIILSLTARR